MQMFKKITTILNALMLVSLAFFLLDEGFPRRIEGITAIIGFFILCSCNIFLIGFGDSELQKMKTDLKKLEIQLKQAEIKERLKKMGDDI